MDVTPFSPPYDPDKTISASPRPLVSIKPPAKRPRCPKGTRKNKKTGECDKVIRKMRGGPSYKVTKKLPQKTWPANYVIPNATPQEDRDLGKAIQSLVEKGDIKTHGKPDLLETSIPKIRGELIKQKSFSPSVNKRLVTIHKDIRARDIFGCGAAAHYDAAEHILKAKTDIIHRYPNAFKIKVGVKKNGKLDCIRADNPKATKILLENLKASGNFNCALVTAPMQVKSNCWFNTMFMTFFVSDKGRKFFRFFRQLMIEGKQENGNKIRPDKLRQSFLLLNACIEASYNQTGTQEVMDLAYKLDTNNIIVKIHNSMPKGKRVSAIKDVDKSGNPLSFYRGIVNYLGNNSLKLESIEMTKDLSYLLERRHGSFQWTTALGIPGNDLPDWGNEPPDIIAVTIHDGEENNPGGDSRLIDNRPLEFEFIADELKTGQYKPVHKYVLDSVVIRDTTAAHFCSLLTCNGEEKGFDGASLSRVSPFKWKQYINANKQWTFKGSNWNNKEGDPIWWNFRDGYQILFYYKI
jgi:hypothetical protein